MAYMMGAGPARTEAYWILRRVAQGKPINEALAEHSGRISSRDRQLVTQICYGVLRHRRYLDAWMAPWVRSKLDPEVEDILRMAFFQLGFLDRVPDYAIVHAAVELTKSVQPKAQRLVNAVLRRAMGHRPQQLSLAVAYSHPDWLVERWRKRYGEEVEAILMADNEIPPLTLRVNQLRTSRQAVLHALAAQAVEASASEYLPEAVRVTGSLWLEHFAPYVRGEVSVQDESGMLVAWALAEPATDHMVLDLAAGLGGKSTHLLERWPEASVVAVDRSHARLRGLSANAQRLGLVGRLTAVHDDARHFVQAQDQRYRRIILDAPCSGLGVLRRRVDARWSKRPEDLVGLVALQQTLLEAAWQALAPGGKMVYSTCSVEPEETVDQMAWALSHLPHAQLGSLSERMPSEPLKCRVEEGMLSLVPGDLGMDGFFIAELEKSPSPN